MMNFLDDFLSTNRLKQVEVAEYLGVTKQTISSINSGALKMSSSLLEKLKAHPGWDTSMLPDVQQKKSTARQESKVKSIPLLPQAVAAGYLNGNNGAEFYKAIETVTFADFFDRGADFAVRVDGDSMYPRYNNGDILACRVLLDRNLFDFGRVYVLNTRNGSVIKKVLPSAGDPDKVLCHSENPMYPDYEISKSDILGVAVVVGHAGVE